MEKDEIWSYDRELEERLKKYKEEKYAQWAFELR